VRPRLYLEYVSGGGFTHTAVVSGGERVARRHARGHVVNGVPGRAKVTITRQTDSWSELVGVYELGRDGKARCLS
jgi:hypothetical protein